MNVLLVAEESAGIQVLRMLASTQHRVVAVMTAPPSTGGGATVARAAESLGVPVLPSDRVRDPRLADWIREQEVDLLLNVHSLYLIHGDIVAAPRIGSFNLHPGPLPEYAGLNAPSWAIYRGETHHAVTLHWMDPEIDTGAIAYESRFEIAERDTGLSLSARCVREGLPLIERLLAAAERGPEAVPARAQDLSRRTYFSARDVPSDGWIDWSRPAVQIVRLVRACDYFPFPSPWGLPRIRVEGQLVAVTKAARTGDRASAESGTVGTAGEGVRVAAADEWVAVQRVKVNGEAVPAEEVLAPGMHLGPPGGG
jgi:methionyl-tRNA formyltransferase